jgi:hypothetical protein
MIFPTAGDPMRATRRQVLANLRGNVLQLQLRKLFSYGKHLLALIHVGISNSQLMWKVTVVEASDTLSRARSSANSAKGHFALSNSPQIAPALWRSRCTK